VHWPLYEISHFYCVPHQHQTHALFLSFDAHSPLLEIHLVEIIYTLRCLLARSLAFTPWAVCAGICLQWIRLSAKRRRQLCRSAREKWKKKRALSPNAVCCHATSSVIDSSAKTLRFSKETHYTGRWINARFMEVFVNIFLLFTYPREYMCF
jgi:hypothetical protein